MYSVFKINATNTYNLQNIWHDTSSSQEQYEGTEKPHHIHVLESTTSDPAESIYAVALVAAIGAAFTMAVIGFAVGWYTYVYPISQ